MRQGTVRLCRGPTAGVEGNGRPKRGQIGNPSFLPNPRLQPSLANYAYPHCFRLSCLHVAAKAGDKAIVRLLVEKGADLNAKDVWLAN